MNADRKPSCVIAGTLCGVVLAIASFATLVLARPADALLVHTSAAARV